jgi:glutaredoxin
MMGRRFARAAWFLVMMLVLAGPRPAPGADAPAERSFVVTLFWGRGCPHCEQEQRFLQDLRRRHPGLQLKEYEVWKNKENAALYRRVLEAAKVSQSGVPGTVVGTSVFLGFNERTRAGIEQAAARCAREGCPDGVQLISSQGLAPGDQQGTFRIPILGAVDPANVSLPVLTIVLAGLDSFNPCAFFVLLFLLSILVHARSRKRMLLVGGIFVLFSGIVYFLFMAAWLNIFMVMGQLAAITIAGGIIALVVGAINIKDFFLFKQGVSLVIPEAAKPKLFERMRGLMKAQSLAAMIAGTVVLAVSANAYELLCTAGFPMVYTRVLTLQGLAAYRYYQYLALYNIVYVAPLAVIVAAITITLGARKLTEWQGRQLKLVSGLMMASLGVILLTEPALLNNVLASVALLAGVVAVSVIAILIMRRMRPEITA